MNKERKTDPRTQIRRNYGFRKMLIARRQAEYWRKRWETHPETMRSNLDTLNRTRKEKAAERTKRLLAILELCPLVIPSWDIKKTFESAIVKAGFAIKAGSFKTLMIALRRRGLISFDSATLLWTVKR